MDISHVLATAFEAAGAPGELISPIELAAEVARRWDKPVGSDKAAFREVARAALTEALGQVMMSARLSAASGAPPSNRMIALLRWLCVTLYSWSEEVDPERRQLTAALFMVATLGSDVEVLIRACPALKANTALKAELAGSISELRGVYSDLDAYSMPLWEREFADRFIAADAARDWVQLAQAWPRLEAASRLLPEISATIRLLACIDCLCLAGALRGTEQTAIAMQVMSILTVEQRLVTAAHCGNAVIAFAALHQSFRHRSEATLPDAIQVTTTNLLREATGDIALWRGWMAVFGSYPPNYAALQVPLGQALAHAPPGAVAAYIETLALKPRNSPSNPSRLAVANCLRAFRALADATSQNELWLLAFQRWSAWRFNVADVNSNFFELQWSDLDYAVYQYVLNCLGDSERHERETAVLTKIFTIEDRWHLSISLLSTEWFRLLSELQPYANAQSVRANLHDADDIEHAFMPNTLCGCRYTEIMFDQAGTRAGRHEE